MLCENCGENEANIRYKQNINGVKKEYNLCEKCSKLLGIGDIDFNIPIDFSSFLGEFLGEYNNSNIFPEFTNKNELKCNNCGMTYDEFVNTGKFGCKECYNTFSERIDPILKNLHGLSTHIGRNGKINKLNEIKKQDEIEKEQEKEQDELTKLKSDLSKAIKEERFEDAALLRDQIKKLE